MVSPCSLCGASEARERARFDAPPLGETDFNIAPYRRTLVECLGCGHFVNRHDFDLAKELYRGAYARATYGDQARARFDRIMALPPERSDNRRRVARLLAFAAAEGRVGVPSLLDVGSGLGVFPAAMRQAGWHCTALDPDPSACDLIRELAGVATIVADFVSLEPGARYDFVTLNKVLEHVPDMAAMLRRVHAHLVVGGWVYVEVPDGEAAIAAGPDREEFFVEHYAAFSMASLALLMRQAGFEARLIERIREPSGKFTLRAFGRAP